MKKVLAIIIFISVAGFVSAQTIGGTETVKVVDGDSLWSPTINQIKTFVQATAGTVTSVAATVPTGLSVSGSPITTSGTLAITNNMAAGVVHSAGVAGALTSGAVALASDVSGTLPVGNGGTGATTLTANALLLGNTTSAITSLTLGTANQILGMNSGGTAHEYKSFAVGTTGTNFAVAHTANTVTFNLPDASVANRGVITTGAQSVTGLKTFATGSVHTGQTTVEAIQANGVIGQKYAAISTTDTLDGTNNYIGLDSSVGAFTITLPAVATATDWVYTFSVVGTGTNFITIDANGAETFVDGSTQKLISGQGNTVQMQSNGTNWLLSSR